MSGRALQAAVIAILGLIVIAGAVFGGGSVEDRAAALGTRIKCPVCRGTAIADSPSETAVAMMAVIEEKIEVGWSDRQIIEYFQDRYGEAILLDPPFAGKTLLVWLLPAAALVGGVWLIARRRRVPTGAEVRQ